MEIECSWRTSDWNRLRDLLTKHSLADHPQFKLHYVYLQIQSKRAGRDADLDKEVEKLCETSVKHALVVRFNVLYDVRFWWERMVFLCCSSSFYVCLYNANKKV